MLASGAASTAIAALLLLPEAPAGASTPASNSGVSAVPTTHRNSNGQVVQGVQLVPGGNGGTGSGSSVKKLNPVAFQLLGYGTPPTSTTGSPSNAVTNSVTRTLLQLPANFSATNGIGATGATGANGATGTAGTNGATGTAGTNGSNGATGATGATGTNGSNGSNGATGA
ncbi:MAG TPA: hypothetical protein VNU19_16900, partial [Candidatus Acidoferrum sp.]|nr:hypothetical protein [Candidatus Acidoferrum sp.]